MEAGELNAGRGGLWLSSSASTSRAEWFRLELFPLRTLGEVRDLLNAGVGKNSGLA